MPSLHGQGLILRILDICELVWTQVRTRLCIDSPETSTDDAEDDSSGGAKDMLSYSWRALRDSRLVVKTLLSSAYLTS